MTKAIKHIIILIFISVAAYFIHKYFLSRIATNQVWIKSGYSLINLYLFGFFSSLILQILLIIIHKVEPKYLGFGFLALLTLKVLTFYLYINKGLNISQNNFLEYNFISIFFFFLFCDVFAAFNLLND